VRYTGHDVVLPGDGVCERRRAAGAHQESEGRSTDRGRGETLRSTAGLRTSLYPRARHCAQVRAACLGHDVISRSAVTKFTLPSQHSII